MDQPENLTNLATPLSPTPAKVAPWKRPLLKDWLFWTILGISLATAVFGIIPFMGIPGAIICVFAVACLGMFPEFEAAGPEAWGAAILLTLVIPPILPLSYALAWHALRKLHWALKGILTLAPALIVTLALTYVMFAGYQEKARGLTLPEPQPAPTELAPEQAP